MKERKILKLRGKTIVFIDWANVYNWKKSLRREINIEKLYKCLEQYSEIRQIRFYFGKVIPPKIGGRDYIYFIKKNYFCQEVISL